MCRIKTLLAMAATLLVGMASLHAQSVELVGITNSIWKYSNDNSDQYAAGFPNVDDSTWLEGRGLFGNDGGYPYPFIVQFNGTGGTPPGPQTAYYRIRFNWASTPGGVVLTMTNFLDDGMVLYLNGVEIHRTNLTDSPVLHTSATPGTITEGTARVYQLNLDALVNGNPNPLITGQNILAASVHQTAGASSDHVFGLSVYGAQAVAPCTPAAPANVTAVQCRNATFTLVLPPNCGIPSPTIEWFRNLGGGDVSLVGTPGISGQTGTSLTVSNVQGSDAGQYFAQLTNPSGSASSGRATLTVTADVAGPQVVSVVYTGGPDNTFVITYNEPVVAEIANSLDPFNHTFNGNNGSSLAVSTMAVDPANPAVILANTGLDAPIPGVSYTYEIGTSAPILDACTMAPSGILTGPVIFPGPISVGPTGSATYAFGTAPYKEEFSTGPFPGGADGVADTAALFDAKVQALDVANLGVLLATDAAATPAAGATGKWSSTGGFLFTRPTGVAGNVIVAHLVNNSGAAQTGLEITYNLTELLRVAEEVPGHLVYFSVSGAPNTWTQIPVISGDGTTGLKTGVVDLSGTPWPIGSSLHILFADDNGSGSPDTFYQIDNFSVALRTIVVTPPEITLDPVSGGVTFGHTFRLTATASGSSPTFQWYKVGTPDTAIPGATTATYTAVADGTTAGGYYVIASNTGGSDRSATATITVRPVVAPYGTVWKYSIDSQDATLTGGTPWYATGFDDSAWLSGAGPLGIETTAATIARLPAPIATALPAPSATFLTAYFRTTVTVPTLTAGQTLVLTHLVDDGAAFYVDGALAFLYNMTNTGPILSTDVAPGTAPGDGDANMVSRPVTLSPGVHTIAAEVHQNVGTSSDILFGAELRVITSTAPALTITQTAPNTIQLSWTADPLYSLFSSANVAGTYTRVAGNPQGSLTLTSPTAAATFYRIQFNGQ